MPNDENKPTDRLRVEYHGYHYGRAWNQARQIAEAMVKMGVRKCDIMVEATDKVKNLEKRVVELESRIKELEPKTPALPEPTRRVAVLAGTHKEFYTFMNERIAEHEILHGGTEIRFWHSYAKVQIDDTLYFFAQSVNHVRGMHIHGVEYVGTYEKRPNWEEIDQEIKMRMMFTEDVHK